MASVDEPTVDEDEPTCRICFDTSDTSQNPLFRPCHCRGTSQWVHVECLDTWRRTSVVRWLPSALTRAAHRALLLPTGHCMCANRMALATAQNPKSFYECEACKYKYKFGTGVLGDQFLASRLLSTAGAVHALALASLCLIIFLAGFVAKCLDPSLDWMDVLRCFNLHHLIAGVTMTGAGSLLGWCTSALGLTGLNRVHFFAGDIMPGRDGHGRGGDGVFGTLVVAIAVAAGLCVAFSWIYHWLEEWSRKTARHVQHVVLDVQGGAPRAQRRPAAPVNAGPEQAVRYEAVD